MSEHVRVSSGDVHIKYCVPCDYTLRATWVASELLTKHPREIVSFELEPGTKGDFEFSIDGPPRH